MDGTLTLIKNTPGILVFRIEGRGVSRHADELFAILEPASRAQPTTVFADFSALRGYETELRVRLTNWFDEHRREAPRLHVLFESKLVAMGVAVAALALGSQMTAYTSRRNFERALAEAEAALRR